jgi:hypothetical protein
VRLVFLYGPVASGKLTVARHLAERTGLALFHNHLVVDAVAAVFPFGSEGFVRLREQFWLDTFAAAAAEERSLVFTFAPEPTVAPDFPARVQSLIKAAGGEVIFVRFDVSTETQEQRLTAPSRAAFGKLQSPELLRALRDSMNAALQAMPEPALTIDTDRTRPEDAAEAIAALLASRPAA